MRLRSGLRPRRVGLAVLSAAAMVAVFAYVFHSVDPGAALAALRNADPLFIGLASGVNVLTIFSQGQRLHALTGAVAPLSRAMAAEAVTLGFAASQVLPARGGEVVKLTILNRATQLRSPTLLAIITVENVLNGVGLLAVAAGVVLVGGAPEWVRKAAVFGATGLAVVVLVIARVKPGPHDDGAGLAAWLRRQRNHLHAGFEPIRRPKTLALAMLYTLVSWGLELATAMLTLAAFEPHTPTVLGLLLMLGVNGALLLPVVPGQIGVYELAAAFVLKQAGMPASTAIMVALLYHLVHMVPTLSLAGLFLVRRQLR